MSMTECEYCTRSFEKVGTKKYCSTICRRRARSSKENPLLAKVPINRECPTCGTAIDYSTYAGKIYCSKKCKENGAAKKQLVPDKERLLEFASVHKKDMDTSKDTFTCVVKGMTIFIDGRIVPCLKHYNIILKGGYAYLSYKSSALSIHKITYLMINGILSDSNNLIDHINRNKLDNRIDNLRLATPSQNVLNKPALKNKKASTYKGVHKTASDKWQAMIWYKDKNHGLGSYDTPEEAAEVYNAKCIELYGEYSYLNDFTSE